MNLNLGDMRAYILVFICKRFRLGNDKISFSSSVTEVLRKITIKYYIRIYYFAVSEYCVPHFQGIKKEEICPI